MRQKTDINKAKAKIRLFIIAKNMLAYKFAFKGEINVLQPFLYAYEDKNLAKQYFLRFIKAFGISSTLMRKVDCAVKINGKATWLSKIVIKEMIDKGELMDTGNSYKASKTGGYSKCYPLDSEFIEELTYDKHYSNLSDSVYDEVRDVIESICPELDIYQHDVGHQAKQFVRCKVQDCFEELSFEDMIENRDIITDDHDEWLKCFYEEDELKDVAQCFKSISDEYSMRFKHAG